MAGVVLAIVDCSAPEVLVDEEPRASVFDFVSRGAVCCGVDLFSD